MLGEPARLDLDEGVAPHEIDDEAVERHLELVARLAHVQLQRRVERALGLGADVVR